VADLAVLAHPGVELLPNQCNFVVDPVLSSLTLHAIDTIPRLFCTHCALCLLCVQPPTVRVQRLAIPIRGQDPKLGWATHDSDEGVGLISDNHLPGGLDLLTSGWEADDAVDGHVLGPCIAVTIVGFWAAHRVGSADVS